MDRTRISEACERVAITTRCAHHLNRSYRAIRPTLDAAFRPNQGRPNPIVTITGV